MLGPATALAVLLYLVPVVVVIVARSARERPLWAFALDLPLAIAVDLFAVLVASFVLPLETAALVTRGIWIAAGIAIARRRRARGALRWPAALDGRAVISVALAAAACVALSLVVSRPYAIWDRYWHFPLVASMGGQRLPFHNVFQPEVVLRYHFTGNVLATELVAFSGRVLHGSLALSLAHDVLFGLLGISLALIFLASGYRGAVATALATFGVVLDGPVWFLRNGLGKHYEGYSFVSFYEVSYKPHILLAGMFVVGVTGAVIARLRGPRDAVPTRETAPVLVACLLALGITAEASTLVLGVAVAVAWLACPDAVHPRRLVGLGLLAFAAAGALAANVVFSASISPGGPAHAMAWVAARSPGLYNEGPRPLATPEGRRALAFDVAALVTTAAGLTLATLRRITRGTLTLLAFALALGGLGVLLLTHIDLNRMPLECHRFMMAPAFVFALLALVGLGDARARSLERILFAASVAVPAICTLLWTVEQCPHDCPARLHFGKQDFYTIDCRAATGAHLGEAARPGYVAQPIIGLYTGCRPIYISGGESTHWGELKTGGPFSGLPALAWIDAGRVPPGTTVHAACDPGDRVDPVCRYAIDHDLCRQEGTLVLGCDLSPEVRARILAGGK